MKGLDSESPLACALSERCRVLGTSTIYEASHLNCMVDPAIRPVWTGAFVAAPAFPLVCSPGDNLAIHIAMERAPRGSVLVVATSDFVAGYWGEVLTVAAEAAGVAGIIIDGGVRDIAALAKRRFPAFSRGISMRGTIKKSAPSVGKPITFAGLQVAPGDLVVGDDDGVMILPSSAVESALAAAEQRARHEAEMMEKLQTGSTTLELLGLQGWRDQA